MTAHPSTVEGTTGPPAEVPGATAVPGASQELAPLPSREQAVLTPLPIADVRGAMDAYQRGLRDLLAAGDWQDKGSQHEFIKKSGYRKIAVWFGLDIELLREEVHRAASDDEHPRAKRGDPIRATVVARAVAPNGRHADGDGRCSIGEQRFSDQRGRQKLEHDLPATATSRAINRAISNLVGLGEVGSDAGDGEDQPGSAPAPDPTQMPWFMAPADPDETARAHAALMFLLTAQAVDAPLARKLADATLAALRDLPVNERGDALEHLPILAAKALRIAGRQLAENNGGEVQA